MPSHQQAALPEFAAVALPSPTRAAPWYVRSCRAVLRAMHESRSRESIRVIARYRHLRLTSPEDAGLSSGAGSEAE